jgi:hypothetical protein
MRFTGNGVGKVIVLPNAPQNPSGLIIWTNGKKLNYPRDWQMENFVEHVNVLIGGEGYAVNDIISLPHQSGNISAFIKVTKIDEEGAIISAKVENKGSYQPPAELYEIPGVGGIGKNAVIGIVWGGKVVNFTNPLPISNHPNIWIMEAGNTFEPAPENSISTTYEGGALSSVTSSGGHPEELMILRTRDQIKLTVNVSMVEGITEITNQSFASNGIEDQFPIGLPATTDSSFIVSNNGYPMEQEIDYVVNLDTQRIVFINPPSQGTINIYSMRKGLPEFKTDNFTLSQAQSPDNEFNLTDIPSTSQSVRVKLNDSILNPYWDYTVSVDKKTVKFHPQSFVQSTDTIAISYPVGLPEIPSLGFSMINGINQQEIWIRNSKRYITVLLDDVLFNSTQITIEDGRAVDDPTPSSPGSIWIGGEKILYWNKTRFNENPDDHRTTLSGLTRGSNLTSGSGIISRNKSYFWNGDGVSTTFNLPDDFSLNDSDSITVIVDGKIKIYYAIQSINNKYILKFMNPGDQDAQFVPASGVKNIVAIYTCDPKNISHPSRSIVINAGINQEIIGGVLLQGPLGLQHSNSTQSKFLLQEPLTI